MRLASHDQRPTTDDAVFGKVRCARHDFTAPGQEGLCPLDAELSLPTRGYADLLREWTVDGATAESYRASQPVIERILGLSLRLQAIETAVVEAAGEVTPFYERPAEPAAPSPAARPQPVGKELRATLKGKAVAMSRLVQRVAPCEGATYPAARGAHRWRRGAATAGGDPRSGAHRDPGQYPCHGVSVGHRQHPAGGDPSAAHGLGTRLPGSAAGWADRRHHHRHHRVGGRGA